MQMLTKFESKSPRVKGIAFHPKQPLLAASLHNGTIQLWNYQMGTLVDRYDEHDGPVRAIAFHPSQPIFVSGGDDYKIKLWNYKQRKCLFTLTGHLDYVRTTFFHREYPWILSASDDQTIRIWNWQSRTCIAILTGHNHFIMSAQFHPFEDLIVSASMDLTVRVWDISGLRKKNQAHQAPMSFEEQIQRANQGQADLFGNTDAVVKYVLEGHDRGVNWASFHPTLPLIVSCGDDRQIKLWRMSDTKAWEVDTCRGHFNNVSVTIFHPRHELILSDGEDKTIRVWDMTKRTAVQTFRREHDKFWVLTAHPHLNLFAAGHDNGLIVFKLERERPAFSLSNNTLFYVRDKTIRMRDLVGGNDVAVMTVRKLGSQYIQPRSMSYNPAEKAVIVTSTADSGVYELIALPKDGGPVELKDSATEGKRGQGVSAIFVARNRLAVLDKTAQSIEIRDLNNTITKTIKCPVQTSEIFYGGTASLLLSSPTSIVLYDIQQQKTLAEISTPPVKYVVWSIDGNMVALLSKHTITIANKSLTQSSLIHETIRIKSAAWDDTGILIYTTLNHIKYALPQGDNGIIKTLEQPVYLTRVRGNTVFCLDRMAKPRTITIDPTEYRFKLALVRKNYDEVLQIIRTSNLVGQSIIGYLQKKGYPEIALHFVQDSMTRFDLAIECGNLTVALEMAKALEKEDVWKRLGQQALKQGNHTIVEMAYQKAKEFDKLSFLYMVTGNTKKLGMMQGIAVKRGDQMARFQNSLYLGDVESRVAVLRDTGMYALAYFTAKTNGLDELADEIAELAGLTDDDLPSLPSSSSKPLGPPPIITHQIERNWPTRNLGQSFFDRALASGAAEMSLEDGVPGIVHNDVQDDGWAADDAMDADEDDQEDPAGEDEGWDLDAGVVEADEDDEVAEAEGEEDVPDGVEPGIGEDEQWTRNSPLALDHAAAGSFETAMALLNRQIGAVDFAPLRPHFLAAYQSAHLYVPANPSLPPLALHVRRNPDVSESRDVLPLATISLESIKTEELDAGFKAFNRGRFDQALTTFRSILQKLMLVIATSDSEVAEIAKLVASCREYVIGLMLETSRRALVANSPDNVSRNLELAAYFTHCGLQPAHLQLALRSAMVTFAKAGNDATAAVFAKRLIDLNLSDAKVISSARSVLTKGDRNPRDAVGITYDHFTEFVVCPASLTPIYKGAPSVQSSFTGAKYLPEYKGKVCKVDEVTQVGLSASGLRSKV